MLLPPLWVSQKPLVQGCGSVVALETARHLLPARFQVQFYPIL